ncbi:hypothetical protein TIFTF001_007301 [Ficus carica]|uniref:Heat shock factor binding protein n=1 Tax=Ficus carica TaxID=3494 RepID=A0AA88A2P4_FICCA|nr:hypothetical protein TIFTF001_007301 [Ficus carica]
MDGHNGEDSKQSTADMSAFVQDLLQQMQCRFQAMSDSIVTKNILSLLYYISLTFNALDDMGTRINELEKSINDLKTEMGMEGSPSPMASSKPNADDVKPEDGSA